MNGRPAEARRSSQVALKVARSPQLWRRRGQEDAPAAQVRRVRVHEPAPLPGAEARGGGARGRQGPRLPLVRATLLQVGPGPTLG